MARQPRFVLPGYPQHVIQRGNNRSVIFGDKADYRFYLDKLAEACARFNCSIHAYVLMTNHVHMLITPEIAHGIGKLMQALGRSYVQYFNYRYRRTGTLWEGRYKAALLDTDAYLLACYRYIELNPVRAGMVGQPGQYRWSSYHYNATGTADPVISPHEGYLQLGTDAEQRRAAYRDMFVGVLCDSTLKTIRAATNGTWVLGKERFRAEIEDMLKRQAAPIARGGDRKSMSFQRRLKINRV